MALSQVSIFLFVCFNKCFLFLPKGPDTDLHLLFFLLPSVLFRCNVLASLLLPCQRNPFSQSWELHLQLQHHSRQQFQARLAVFHLQWASATSLPVILIVFHPPLNRRQGVQRKGISGLLWKSTSLQGCRLTSIFAWTHFSRSQSLTKTPQSSYKCLSIREKLSGKRCSSRRRQKQIFLFQLKPCSSNSIFNGSYCYIWA